MGLLIAFTCILVAVTLAANVYFASAARQYAAARKMCDEMFARANRLLEGDYSDEVRSVVFRLAATTGCGCYVRSLLVEHFAPKISRAIADRYQDDEEGVAMEHLRSLPAPQKREFNEFIAHALAFDAFSNPGQGWVLRHVLSKRFGAKAPRPVPTPSKEEQAAVVRVATRKVLAEPCAAH